MSLHWTSTEKKRCRGEREEVRKQGEWLLAIFFQLWLKYFFILCSLYAMAADAVTTTVLRHGSWSTCEPTAFDVSHVATFCMIIVFRGFSGALNLLWQAGKTNARYLHRLVCSLACGLREDVLIHHDLTVAPYELRSHIYSLVRSFVASSASASTASVCQ